MQNKKWPYPGARWWKFDFHTHTPESKDTPWHTLIGTESELTPEKWLQKYMDAEVDCVAITDHNSGAWIDKLKDAYKRMRQQAAPGFRELHLFPGVEISVNGGFHLLVILDKNKTASDINDLLAKVYYEGTNGDSNGVTRKSPTEVIEAALEADGIPIPAHADSRKGLLRVEESNPASPVLDANTIKQVLEQPGLLAMEVINPSGPMPAVYEQLGLSWSKVLGSDCHNFRSGNQPGSRYTWVKMASPSLEGLRLALLDGAGFSIRRSNESESFDPFRHPLLQSRPQRLPRSNESESFDPFRRPEHFIEAVEIADARYMGRSAPAKFRFSPWLNALVGGRGTGKSTVIHALRLAARREHELKKLDESSEPHRTFEQFNQAYKNRNDMGGWTDKTKITCTVMRYGVRHRVHWHWHWQQDGRDAAVEEDDGSGNWIASQIQTVPPERFPLRIFSQGQIAALAGENQQALLQVIDEAAEVETLKKVLEESKREFDALRARIREFDGKLGRRDALVVEQRDVERRLKRFEEAGHTVILTTYRRRNLQRRETDWQFEVSEKAAELIEEAATAVAALQPEDLPEGLFDTAAEEERQAAAIMAALAAAVGAASQDLRGAAQRLRGVIGSRREQLAESAWQAAFDQAVSSYETLVKALRAEGVTDLNEYGRLTQERQRLDSELKDLESLKEERGRLSQESQSLLWKVLEARRDVSAAREEFLEETLAQNEFVCIRSQIYGSDPQAVERSLREALKVPDDRFEDDIFVVKDDGSTKGIVAALLENLPAEPVMRRSEIERRIDDLKRRIEAACSGRGDFGGHLNNYLEREFKRSPELLDKLLTWFPDDGLQVEYSRSGDGKDFQPIAQASAGQRAAAMLAFLLAHGEEPLVVDQPEDDLDNHLIYDLIVRQIRKNKLRRQIVVVTHNPNIVVNGDAEMLHALDFLNGQCVIAQSGSLQKKDMRDEICRVMEGGSEAFKRRYRRLEAETTHV